MTSSHVAGSTPPPTLIYNERGLAQMLGHLSRQSAFALDTESNSFYVYYPKVCLIQITTYARSASSNGDAPDALDVVDYLVDPLRLEDLRSGSTR